MVTCIIEVSDCYLPSNRWETVKTWIQWESEYCTAWELHSRTVTPANLSLSFHLPTWTSPDFQGLIVVCMSIGPVFNAIWIMNCSTIWKPNKCQPVWMFGQFVKNGHHFGEFSNGQNLGYSNSHLKTSRQNVNFQFWNVSGIPMFGIWSPLWLVTLDEINAFAQYCLNKLKADFWLDAFFSLNGSPLVRRHLLTTFYGLYFSHILDTSCKVSTYWINGQLLSL